MSQGLLPEQAFPFKHNQVLVHVAVGTADYAISFTTGGRKAFPPQAGSNIVIYSIQQHSAGEPIENITFNGLVSTTSAGFVVRITSLADQQILIAFRALPFGWAQIG